MTNVTSTPAGGQDGNKYISSPDNGVTETPANNWLAGDLARLGPSLLTLSLAIVGGAGRHPWVLAVCVMTAALGLAVNKPPAKTALFVFWCLGMVFIAWHLFTLVPLPRHSLGPQRARFFHQADRKLAELRVIESVSLSPDGTGTGDAAGEINTGTRRYGRLTLNQAGTKRFILIVIGSWSMFWLSTTMTSGQRLRFLALLVFIGAMVAVLGLFGRYVISPGNRVWWVFPVDHEVGAGPFINRNHFASFCALLTPVALSLVLAPVSWYSRPSPPAPKTDNDSPTGTPTASVRGHGGRFSLFAGWSHLSDLGRRRLFYGLALAALAAAPVLSLSRGGMVMMLLGCLTTSMFWVRGRSASVAVGAVLAAAVLFSFLLRLPGTVPEQIPAWQQTRPAAPDRMRFMHEAFNQWRDYAFFGGGADSFRVLNGLYKLEPSTGSPLYAENEYVQFLADHGLAGAFLGLLLVAGLLIGFWSNFHDRFQRTRSLRVLLGTWARDQEIRRRHRELYAPVVPLPILAGASGVVIGLLFHFSCDFPTRVPLNAFLAAALLATAMPLPNLNATERSHYWRWPLRLYLPGSLIILLFWSGRDQLRLDEPTYLQRAELSSLKASVQAAPSYWVAWHQMSSRLRQKAEQQLNGEQVSLHNVWLDPFKLYRHSVDCLRLAAEYNPRDWRLWHASARAKMVFGEPAREAVHQALETASRLAPHHRDLWREWLAHGLTGSSLTSAWNIGETALTEAEPRVALAVWRDLLAWSREAPAGGTSYEYRCLRNLSKLQPDNPRWWRDRARLETSFAYRPQAIASRQRLAELNPEDWRNWRKLGILLLEDGSVELADQAFSRALNLRPELAEETDRLRREFQAPGRP